ncbi:MAG: hypothetical protein JO142_19885 [Burkholderiales bacterium]|nr:hypothetical protein [Burkholderiales bacterium]
MRRFSHLDNFVPRLTLRERVTGWVGGFVEFAACLFGLLTLGSAVWQVASWGMHLIGSGNWFLLAGSIVVAILFFLWLFTRSTIVLIFTLAALPLAICFLAAFVSKVH